MSWKEGRMNGCEWRRQAPSKSNGISLNLLHKHPKKTTGANQHQPAKYHYTPGREREKVMERQWPKTMKRVLWLSLATLLCPVGVVLNQVIRITYDIGFNLLLMNICWHMLRNAGAVIRHASFYPGHYSCCVLALLVRCMCSLTR